MEDGATDREPRHTVVIQRRIHRNIGGLRELQLLVHAGKRRLRLFKLRCVEARRDTHIPCDADGRVTIETESALSPGRRDDPGFDLVALDAKIAGRLV